MAMETICADEMICRGKTVPDYERIIDALNRAIIRMSGNLDAAQFEWLGLSTEPSLASKLRFLCLGSEQ